MKSVRAEILRSSLTGIEAVMSLLNKPKDAPMSGYLVEASPWEIASIGGFNRPEDVPCARSNGYGSAVLSIGTKIHVGKAWDYLKDLRNQAADAKRSATLLRSLAELLSQVPTTIEAPKEKAPPVPSETASGEIAP
jgi:hypothetical protein